MGRKALSTQVFNLNCEFFHSLNNQLKDHFGFNP